jgi:serine phosphatase RsbU (regulator of sigma subunit)
MKKSLIASWWRLAYRLWPDLKTMGYHQRLTESSELFGLLYMAPLALLGIAWLILATDLAVIQASWHVLLLFALLYLLFELVRFFVIIEIWSARYGSSDESFSGMIQMAAGYLFGPTSLWIATLTTLVKTIYQLWREDTTHNRISNGFQLSMTLIGTTLAMQVALYIYQSLGGSYPIAGLSPQDLWPPLVGIAGFFTVSALAMLPLILYLQQVQRNIDRNVSFRPAIRFFLLAIGLPVLSYPFAILVAGLYSQEGLITFLFIVSGLLIVAILARQLSWAVEGSRQQTRQLEKLEALGRAIIQALPGEPDLAELLSGHIPTMFPSGRIAVWLAEEQQLVRSNPEWDFQVDRVWSWVQQHADPLAVRSSEPLPWAEATRAISPLVISPVIDVDSGQPIGMAYLELQALSQPWDRGSLNRLLPALNTLTAQIASTLHQIRLYREAVEYQQAVQELEFAGRIQASFLPNEFPNLDGWELAVTLLPAREMSGDYFDIIPLQEGKIGILIADVADKGLGASLYMALSRTLIRTFALEYDGQPELVFFSVNDRLLEDARAHLFVTAFYGVLDPQTGTLTYCNAGHNPQYLFNQSGQEVKGALIATGMPLGIETGMVWREESVQIEPGDVLLLYTDGIPDSQNSDGVFFKESGLLEAAIASLGLPAQEFQSAILDHLERHVGNAPQFDDITMMVLERNS